MIALETAGQNPRGFGDLRTITFVQFMCFAAGAIILVFGYEFAAMQTTQSHTQPYDDEISLLELWQILIKRKALILACFVLCLAGGAAFAFFTKPVYEASATVRIGQIALNTEREGQLLETPSEFATRINSQYGAGRTSAMAPKGTTSTIHLVTQAPSPDDAVRSLSFLIESIRKDHAIIFEKSLRPTQDRLERLDEQTRNLQQNIVDLTQLIEQIKERDPVQASLLMLERNQLTSSIIQQDAERLHLLQQLTPPQTRPTELIGEITAPAKPSKPKKALVLVLAAVLGIMIGVMLTFIAEFIVKSKTSATTKA